MKFMNIKACVCGYDFTFARRAEGNIRDLEKFFEFYEVKKFIFDDVRVSTTYIRELLSAGNVHEANRLLGRFFSIRGNVVFGSQNGRIIGCPTANVNYKNYFLPGNGVYFVNVKIDEVYYFGMCNIGHNPTFNFQEQKKMEINIFNFDEDIYGSNIEVIVIEKIRNEQKFNNVDELVEQLKKDKLKCLEFAADQNYTK